MKFVVVATHSERYFPDLEESVKQYNHEMVKLGWGEKWRGFGWKLTLLRDYLRSISPDEIICFIDGYDVIILQPADVIERNFKRLVKEDAKNKILISSETSTQDTLNTVLTGLWTNVWSYKCKGSLINAGTYMGYASAILGVLDDICSTYECIDSADDQILIQRFCQKNHDRFIIDTRSEVFLVQPSITGPLTMKNSGLFVENGVLKYGDATPGILHAAGYTDIDDILEALGRKPQFRARAEDKTEYRWKFFKHFVSHIFSSVWFMIILIIFFVVFVIVAIPPGKKLKAGRRPVTR
jgi:hypothetical protein